jgi:hypothetical protein
MQEIFQLAGAIIISFGGSSVILLGLSNWLGKLWTKRIFEKEKQKFAIEIEGYKAKLNKEINMLNSMIEKASYVTKLQYEKEFSIYQDIWEKLSLCVNSTRNLYPAFEYKPVEEPKLKKFIEEKLKIFVDHYNNYSNAITKYSPFYEDKLYSGFVELRNLCNKQGNFFRMYEYDVKYSLSFATSRDTTMPKESHQEVYIEFPKKIDELQNSLKTGIRNYLHSLRAV